MKTLREPAALPDRVVVTSILETSTEDVERGLARAPEDSALVEIRADHLRPSEVAGLVERSPRPVLVAARRTRDGGFFDGSEAERRAVIEGALRAGAALADVEWDTPLIALAGGEFRARIVASHHGGECDEPSLTEIYRALASTGAPRLKLVPRARRVSEGAAVRDLLARARRDGRALAAFATGAAGLPTRIYAPSWGAWATFGALARGRETADGQPTALDLLTVWRVLAIGNSTKRFGLVGLPVLGSPSPAMHATGYRRFGLDACFVPFETSDLEDALLFCGPLGIEPVAALAVTIPLKERAASRGIPQDDVVARSGSANTLLAMGGDLFARNTDAPAALSLIRRRIEPRGRVVAIIGAGGTARALGVALHDAGAEVVLFNRTASRAESAARAVSGSWRSLLDLEGASWDILVNATPLGKEGETILPPESLRGRLVFDSAYGREPTPLTTHARERGLDVVDGAAFLAAQAAVQFELMTGRPIDEATLEAAARGWLSGFDGPSPAMLDASGAPP